MPGMPPPGPAPMQGLEKAAPQPGPQDPQQALMQAAGQLLNSAVQKFGPEIIEVIKEMLGVGPGGGGPKALAPPPGGPGGPPPPGVM